MSGLDLYLSQKTLALLFVYAAVVGFGLGAVYDGLRILRMALGSPEGERSVSRQGRRPPLMAVFLFLEDVLFALTAFVALILLCYYANDGQLRAPAVVGLAGGFFVYLHTLSRPILRLAELILGLLRGFCKVCLRLLAIPLRGLWSLTVGRLMNARREKRTEKKLQDLTEAASRGFGILGDEPNKQDPPA